MRHPPLAIISVILLLTWTWIGCHCGDPSEPPDGTAGTRDGSDVTPSGGGEGVPAEDDSGVSPEVRRLIDGNDATAIAAELEGRATQLRALVGETENRAGELEGTAEAMTGRKEAVDPRDAAVVDTLVASAQSLADGSQALEQDVVRARQLATDLTALADALYGRPAAAADAPVDAPAAPPTE